MIERYANIVAHMSLVLRAGQELELLRVNASGIYNVAFQIGFGMVASNAQFSKHATARTFHSETSFLALWLVNRGNVEVMYMIPTLKLQTIVWRNYALFSGCSVVLKNLDFDSAIPSLADRKPKDMAVVAGLLADPLILF